MSSTPLPNVTDADAVRSREDLASYIQRLEASIASGQTVENTALPRFLEALSAWITDSPGFFSNTGRLPADEAQWSFFAHALSAALIYE